MPSAERRNTGVSASDGTNIYEFTIASQDNSVQFTCLSYGATITKILSPNRDGISENIVLCYDTVPDLQTKLGPYYGSVPGRYANRIAGGKFSLDGEDYHLAVNNGPNSLHGGICGFDKKNWDAAEFTETSRAGVKLSYISIDGEEGYPGELHVTVTYSLNIANELEIEYSAQTSGRATVLNLTNHTYFNLSGNCSRKILDHKLHLSCSHYLPVTDELIPTGEIRSVKNTPFDFLCDASNGTVLGDVLGQIDGGGQPGLDHCLVVDGFVEAAQEADRTLRLRHVATLTDETSGRQLICRATLPAVQVYTANWLPADATQEPHVQHNAICLETQHYPDSPNQPTFPSTVLRPGEEYSHKVVFSFRTIA